MHTEDGCFVVLIQKYGNPDSALEPVFFNDNRPKHRGWLAPRLSRIRIDMDVAYVSALSALAGSVIGGLTSGITSWLNQRSLARAGLLAHELTRRQELYKDFIVAASKAYGEALVVSEPKIEELISLYAMISRMRVISSSNIVASAEQVLLETTGAYFEPNRTVPELRELIRTGTGVDPLKDFAEAVRQESQQFAALQPIWTPPST
jgi:hypothetical protein